MTERSLVVKSLSKPTVLSNMLNSVNDEPTERFEDATDSCTRSRLLPRLERERERDRPRLALPDLDLDLERERDRPRRLALPDLDLDIERDLERDRRVTTLRTCLLREEDDDLAAAAISVMRRLKRPCEM